MQAAGSIWICNKVHPVKKTAYTVDDEHPEFVHDRQLNRNCLQREGSDKYQPARHIVPHYSV